MFEKIIALFERLVVAHEKLAESQEAILRVVDARDPQPVEEPKTEKKTRGKKAEPKPEPAKEPEVVEETKPAPAPKLTLADVKMAVAGYADARLKGGAADPKNEARALMAHHGGGAKKTDEIAEEYWQAVVDACTSGWTPVEEEL